MTTPTKIKKDIQDISNDSGIVSLFCIDLSDIGGDVIYITPGTDGSVPIEFGGNTYTPVPLIVEGMTWTGSGQMPRPTIEIANISFAILAEVIALNDLIGGKVTRLQTYEKYIDGRVGADSTQYLPEDVFYINRKIGHSKYSIKFELKSPVDLEHLIIPKRKALRNCTLIYRTWDASTSAFDYTNVTCPYTDTDYYDFSGTSTTAENDFCGHNVYDCRLRFPSTNNPDNELPGNFFPGIGSFGRPYRK